MAKQGSSTKTIHAVQLPFSEPDWPTVSSQLESDILDILLPLLSPIGTYRSECVAVSRGKGRRTRPRAVHGNKDLPSQELGSSKQSVPDILQHVTVGFNSTIRALESTAQRARATADTSHHDDVPSVRSLSVVLVCAADLPNIMTTPLPLLVATASLRCSSDAAIRLVPISASSADQIAKALNQPRANIVGIMNEVPEFDSLAQLVRTQVNPVDVPWLREAASDKYLPVKIHSHVVTNNPTSKAPKRKRGTEV